MQVVTIAGNVGRDAEVRATRDGTQFAKFSVAVTTGWGEQKATTWWDVTRWGKGADKLAELLVKGAKVSVSGEVSTREHEGKTYLQIRADHVTLQGGNQGAGGHTARQPAPTGRVAEQRPVSGAYQATGGDQLDDDVPF